MEDKKNVRTLKEEELKQVTGGNQMDILEKEFDCSVQCSEKGMSGHYDAGTDKCICSTNEGGSTGVTLT